MWGWIKRKGRKAVERAQEPEIGADSPVEIEAEAIRKIQAAGADALAALVQLNSTCRTHDPDQWPANFITILAHLDLSFLASFVEADDIIDAFGVALQLEFKRLSRAAEAAPPMPSRSLH
jgi:hypothetical protein